MYFQIHPAKGNCFDILKEATDTQFVFRFVHGFLAMPPRQVLPSTEQQSPLRSNVFALALNRRLNIVLWISIDAGQHGCRMKKLAHNKHLRKMNGLIYQQTLKGPKTCRNLLLIMLSRSNNLHYPLHKHAGAGERSETPARQADTHTHTLTSFIF